MAIFIPHGPNPFQVTDSTVEVLSYNLSRDSLLDKTLKQLGGLTAWLSTRACLSSSIVAQKLGLFHNQRCVCVSQISLTIVHNVLCSLH